MGARGGIAAGSVVGAVFGIYETGLVANAAWIGVPGAFRRAWI